MELVRIKASNGILIYRISPDIIKFPLVIITDTSNDYNFIYFDDLLLKDLCNKLTISDLQVSKLESIVKMISFHGLDAQSQQFTTYLLPENFVNIDESHVKCYLQDNPKIGFLVSTDL